MKKRKYSLNPLIYLANPFTHPNKEVMDKRAELVSRAAARLYKHGIMTYPPIALNSHWNAYENFDHTWSAWENFDRNFLERCDGLIVLMLDGWDCSVGVKAEIQYAKELDIPVVYITYEDLMAGHLEEILKVNQELKEKLSSEKQIRMVDIGEMSTEEARLWLENYIKILRETNKEL